MLLATDLVPQRLYNVQLFVHEIDLQILHFDIATSQRLDIRLCRNNKSHDYDALMIVFSLRVSIEQAVQSFHLLILIFYIMAKNLTCLILFKRMHHGLHVWRQNDS